VRKVKKHVVVELAPRKLRHELADAGAPGQRCRKKSFLGGGADRAG
jgi:hypothetical protein